MQRKAGAILREFCVLAMVATELVPTQFAQTVASPADAAKWEAVSIKQCTPNSGFGSVAPSSPDRLILNCQPLAATIRSAYIRYAAAQYHPLWTLLQTTVTGGPSWVTSDQYTINAKADGTLPRAVMQGPMLQGILEDRFKLKLHHETKEIPLYELTVAKNGSKLTPYKEGSCSPVDPTQDPGNTPPPPREKLCLTRASRNGQNIAQDAQGISLDMFAQFFLSTILGQPVINKTGISGLFDFHIEYTNPALNPANATQPDLPPAPSIFTAVEQLGLKLEARKGPGDFLVIDSVERPSEN